MFFRSASEMPVQVTLSPRPSVVCGQSAEPTPSCQMFSAQSRSVPVFVTS